MQTADLQNWQIQVLLYLYENGTVSWAFHDVVNLIANLQSAIVSHCPVMH